MIQIKKSRKTKVLFIFLFLSLFSSFSSLADDNYSEHVVWDKIPIEFAIPVGKERMITFPDKLEFKNTDQNLTTDKVAIINNNGTLYIKAKKSFDPIRCQVVMQNGEIVLLDILAKEKAKDVPVTVVFPEKPNLKEEQKGIGKINYVTLMRYAISNLYSPERLIKENYQITRAPMYTTKSVNLIYGEDFLAMPLISWRGGDLYVTAVLIKNIWNGKNKKRIDLKAIKGNWLAASLYPTNYVASSRTAHDRTTLFLISDRPFNEALNENKEYSRIRS